VASGATSLILGKAGVSWPGFHLVHIILHVFYSTTWKDLYESEAQGTLIL
jgi:hypothetical protein